MNSALTRVVFWMGLVVVGVLVWNLSTKVQTGERPVAFSDFMADVDSGKVEKVTITGNEIAGISRTDNERFRTYAPSQYDGLANKLIERGILVTAKEPTPSPWASLLYVWAPILLLIGFWIFFMRQMQRGGSSLLSFGKSKARLSSNAQKKVTFKDVAGVDEANEELQEIIAFLKEPEKFEKLGGHIPKGVLLMGPPGTGKTLLARGTSGFSGADLASLVNEAALNAARYDGTTVRMADFEFSKDKVLMGSERRSMIISDEEKRITATHEAGHALLTVLLPHADPIHKVTIIPRGTALGLTQQLPVDEKHNYSRDYVDDQIAIMMGGRLAEEIAAHGITTGAGNDFERATELARRMVCEWGMSEAMGPLTFGKKKAQIFLGREIAQHQDYSEGTARRIDQEVKRIVSTNYERARTILVEHKAVLVTIADELLTREVLDGEQVRRIVMGLPLDELAPAASAGAVAAVSDEEETRRRRQKRPTLVPPLTDPLPQE